jgi:hypothetical protein
LIDGGNIGIDMSCFLLGLCEIRVQGREVSFHVLATGMGQDDEETQKWGGWDHTESGLWVTCITMIRVTSRIQWGKAQIRVLEGGRLHKKHFFFLKNYRYDCDKGEERNLTE